MSIETLIAEGAGLAAAGWTVYFALAKPKVTASSGASRTRRSAPTVESVRVEPRHTSEPSQQPPKPDPFAEAYAVLELPIGASKDEIVAAYQKRVREYHPDKTAHLGRDLREMAHKKFIAIQAAYDLLARGDRKRR